MRLNTKIIIGLILFIFTVSCKKNVSSSYIIGQWIIDSISYKDKNYIDSISLREFIFMQNNELICPSQINVAEIDFEKFRNQFYFLNVNETGENLIEFKCYTPILNGFHSYELRNDTLRHYLLLIIKSKDLYIRSARNFFYYNSIIGLNIVKQFKPWPPD